MDMLRLLFTLGGIAAFLSALAYIACSLAAPLFWAVVFSLPVGFLAFGAIMSMGGLSAMLVLFATELLLFFVNDDAFKGRVLLGLRWIAFVAGACTLLWIGGRAVYDGITLNRLVEPQIHYDRCMASQMRTVRVQWRECADGWNSPSIGSRGACSHHGGVVWRAMERREQHQPQDEAYCREVAAARSWLD